MSLAFSCSRIGPEIELGFDRECQRSLYCHCRICQPLNRAPFGDPVFVWRRHVDVGDPSQLTRKRYRYAGPLRRAIRS